jgi:hypothetical protein
MGSQSLDDPAELPGSGGVLLFLYRSLQNTDSFMVGGSISIFETAKY